MNDIAKAPVLVDIWRGETIESRHHGAAAVADGDGRIVAAWGDIERPVYPRSAIKPLQAIPVVDSGAADAYDLDNAEIALACASHSGEPAHTTAVATWLERIGLSPTDLECGTHYPYNAEAAAALYRAGEVPKTLHSNCSGKHSGMLTNSLHLGAPTKGYIAPDHPAQTAWRKVLGEMSGVDLRDAPVAVDGCSVPTIAVPLSGLARAAARFAAAGANGGFYADACRRVQRAMAAAPLMVGGTGRFCTKVIAAAKGAILIKVGAEGVYIGAIPAAGLGIALKIDDGAERAAEVAMAALLERFGDLDGEAATVVAELGNIRIYNRRGIDVGVIRPAPDWLGSG